MNLAFPMPQDDTVTSEATVTGAVTLLLRAEAAIALVAAVLAYRTLDGRWALFATLFLAPDLSMLGYLIGRRCGAWVYNLGHTYLAPAVLGLVGLTLAIPGLYGLALIWVAHIGFDRLIGYGLKYPTAFGATHLGWHGRRLGT